MAVFSDMRVISSVAAAGAKRNRRDGHLTMKLIHSARSARPQRPQPPRRQLAQGRGRAVVSHRNLSGYTPWSRRPKAAAQHLWHGGRAANHGPSLRGRPVWIGLRVRHQRLALEDGKNVPEAVGRQTGDHGLDLGDHVRQGVAVFLSRCMFWGLLEDLRVQGLLAE